MLASAIPHSLRGLSEKGQARLQEMMTEYGLRPGVPLVFLDPGGVVEYRGVPNEPIIEMLHALHGSDVWQLAVLTWAGIDSLGTRLSTMQQRAGFILGRFGLHGVPTFGASGSRAGLVAFAQLVAAALGTTAVVLTRGKDVLEASFSSRFLKPLVEFAGGVKGDPVPTHPLVTVWSYASQSTRSTSSTGSGSRRPTAADEPGGDSPEGAATFAATLWSGVEERLSKVDRPAFRERSFVLVDSTTIAKGIKLAHSGECPPIESIDQVTHRGARLALPKDRAVFSGIFESDAAVAALAATAAAERTRLPAAGLLVVAAVLQEDENPTEWLGENGDILAELAPSTVEQARTLELLAHAFDSGWVPASQTIIGTLKGLHDADIVEDEGFGRWVQREAKNSSASVALKQAAPFLEWLAEAGNDDGDSQGDEGDD